MDEKNKVAWLVDQDYIENYAGDDKQAEPVTVEVLGPRGITLTAAEIKAQGTPFKMYDDDGNLYYTGYCVNSSSFAPLDHYGTPNAGCTEIRYLDSKTGEYKTL